jgi:flagellin
MISMNTNTASSMAAYNIGSTNVNLQKSLQRLSSGYRINSSVDDAGGLAVSMRLAAAIRRTEATQVNLNNTISLLQTQDGVLMSANKTLARLSELAQLSTDVTKSTSDRALYQTEYSALTSGLNTMTLEEFNGIRLFSSGTTLTVIASEDGGQTMGVTQANLSNILTTLNAAVTSISDGSGATTTEIAAIDTAIQSLATLRATNGSEQQRLNFAVDMLEINKINLESTKSRITDVDVAQESSNLARLSILQEAGIAILSQANQSNQSVLRLLV